ncbi:hypothetical protein SEA_SONALI_26 [Arthrobacter phage Sonali]|uniref:Uncharacterized protein n=1 Tax=Arthrobacter phage Sonali TaxID=2510495 RepID=A0A411CQE1_9CAUD|nr:virion structural protein [Arthrobacter phage Sonali]QAY16138.1 hypothetical protein SEA_SONALI_26 [Arthrobacter phage Sonali]
MSKQIIQRYTFDPAARTVTLTDFDAVELGRLALITNVTTNTVIFNFADPGRGATVAGNVITLAFDTTAMSSTDRLRIDYDIMFGDPASDKTVVGNARSKFRDGFATPGGTFPNPSTWDLVNEATDPSNGHILTQGGDSFGSSYLRVSLSPFLDNSEVRLTSRQAFSFPMRVGFGLSMSQRIQGQEVFLGMVGADSAGDLDYTAAPADIPITGATASITSNVATFTVTNHGLKGGDRIEIEFCVERRLNVGPVTATIVDANTFTVPCTLTAGSYPTTGGVVRIVDPVRSARNAAGLLFENQTTTNASFVSRRNGSKFRSKNETVASTTATQSNTNPYTDALNSAANHELYYSLDEVAFRSFASDSGGGMNGYDKYTQGIPDEDPAYKIHVRARNLTGLTRPVARIASIAKTGTSTATVTTVEAHGLAVTDFVQVYGVWDQTNFPNLASQTAVSSVIDANTFTIVIGTAVTASSLGGAVWLNQGSVLAPGVQAQVVQSLSRTNGVLTVIGNTTWTSPIPGELFHLWGLAGAPSYEGAYKVLRASGTTLELDAPGPDFSLITGVGGAAIRRTDVRLHFARVMDFTRMSVEVYGGKGNTNDANNATPVTITGSATVPASQTTGSSSTIWNAAGWGGFLVNDIASAALTSTSTSSAVTPGSVGSIGTYAHEFNVIVTAVSGTNPTMDVAIEESPDNGTNWVRIYEFQRITATGTYTSPLIRSTHGTRYRYVRTVGGTSPSFTNAVNRLQYSSAAAFHRQYFDRSINLATLNSVTPTYNVEGATRFVLGINVGAITTTAPALQLEGSEDGSTWYALAAPLTAVASSTVVAYAIDVLPKFVRARVSTAGVGVTAGYVTIKGHGA